MASKGVSHSVPPIIILIRGLRMQCPNCGHHLVFENGLRLRESCPLCFMRLQRGTGWFLGPMVINYGITVFGLVIPILLLGLFGIIPLWWAVGGIAITTLVIPIALYRWSWGAWLGLYYFFLPHELPATNETFDHIGP